jgi:hypothetical protein
MDAVSRRVYMHPRYSSMSRMAPILLDWSITADHLYTSANIGDSTRVSSAKLGDRRLGVGDRQKVQIMLCST